MAQVAEHPRSPRACPQVRDRASQKFKVKATPTFFINGELHEGGMSIEDLDKAIEPYIKA